MFWEKLKNSRISTFKGTLIIIFAALLAGGVVWANYPDEKEFQVAEIKIPKRKPKIPEKFVHIERPKPPKVSMERMKKEGCIFDGILSEYGLDTEKNVEMLNRSNCYYIHRAIETWRKPPDFQAIDYVMSQITKKDVAYGMFIAEAINKKAKYYDEYNKCYFEFSEMCQEGSENIWGEHTCKPTFESKEYRDYLKYITRKAMDLGVQSFMFGQIYFQDGSEDKWMKQIVSEMREYAKKKKLSIVIGAQTGKITDPVYLKYFDYIEGGVGMDSEGRIEDGPCLRRAGDPRAGSCWALVWHQDFASKAKNVLVHLDWSGLRYDDMSIFARMTKEKREQVLTDLYSRFTSQNVGFLMPFFAVLDKNNGGCYGPEKLYYSANSDYSCKDESIINKLLRKGS